MPEKLKTIEDNLAYYVRTGAAIFLILAVLFILFMVFSIQRRRKLVVEKKQIKLQFQQTLLQAQLEIQEQTLKNISQEIHDNIGQALTLAKLNLNTMLVENNDPLQQKITLSKTLVSKAITDLRDLSHSLNTDYVEQMGLLRSIEYELEMIGKTGIIKTQLQINGQVYRFDKQKELITFRIVQEVLNNIIKHAKAENIIVLADYTTTALVLSIKDDGLGFASSPAELVENSNNSSGLGIRNMHNRAKLIGASLTIDSADGKGTHVTIHLLKENNHSHERKES